MKSFALALALLASPAAATVYTFDEAVIGDIGDNFDPGVVLAFGDRLEIYGTVSPGDDDRLHFTLVEPRRASLNFADVTCSGGICLALVFPANISFTQVTSDMNPFFFKAFGNAGAVFDPIDYVATYDILVPSTVPLPGGIVLLASALGLVGVRRLRH